ncbi:MAG: galactokinase [Actinomycetes bacterium]
MTTRVFHAPGRVNLIGDHIDYMGGAVLPMAIDRGTTVVLTPREDRLLVAESVNFPEQGTITADIDAAVADPTIGWANYLVAVAWVFGMDGLASPCGFDVRVEGNIPNGAGLSSSASIELAFAAALNAFGGFGLNPTQLATIGQRAENGFIGVACGIMDQLSIATGRAGHALMMNCETLDVRPVPFPDDVALVVANTNKRRELADSAYNERRSACESAELTLGRRLVEIDPAELPVLLAELDPLQAKRARHVATEQRRVLESVDALEAGDLTRFGALMRESHESLRDDFEVTGPELDALASAAWAAPGVIGARMTGAGFGGCTVNLVRPGSLEVFMAYVAQQYQRDTGLEPEFYVVSSADGVHELLQ